MLRTHGTLVGRVLIGFLFVYTGIGILRGGVGTFAEMIEGMGLPLAVLIAWLIVAIKILAGGALNLGYRVGLAASALILFVLATVVFVHLSLEDPNLFKNLGLVGGLLYVMAYGAGDGWSIEKRRASNASIEM
jgi:putative oxidoreductase